MPLPAIAAAAIPLLGQGLQFLGGRQTNDANAQQAQANRDFQERMSNTSYQRAVADMKAAGLNPGLAYQQGGASSPTGATAQLQNTLAGAGNSAAAAAQTYNNTRLTAAQAHKTESEAKQIDLQSADALLELQTRIKANAANAQSAAAAGEEHMTGSRLKHEQAQTEFFLRLLRADELKSRIKSNLSNAAETDVTRILKQLDTRRAINEFNAQDTWWMKFISPYLNDAKGTAQLMPTGKSLLYAKQLFK